MRRFGKNEREKPSRSIRIVCEIIRHTAFLEILRTDLPGEIERIEPEAQ